jgi:predicted O-methyltransferase YrrM
MRDVSQADATVRELLRRVYGEAPDAYGDQAFIRAGMYTAELVKVYELIRAHGCRSAVEVGMACGTSSVVILQALADNGGGTLVSVDPFQTAADGYAGKGLQSVSAAGFAGQHRLVEKPDYLGLPQLVGEGVRCDFVLVDGWHSFDYTLVDMFYADLLLTPGGVLTVHDTGMPCVHKACAFLEAHKPYERLSAPVMKRLESLPRRLLRRAGTALAGPTALRAARSRRTEWFALAAYRKRASDQLREDHPVAF